jgi:hypothetical protein
MIINEVIEKNPTVTGTDKDSKARQQATEMGSGILIPRHSSLSQAQRTTFNLHPTSYEKRKQVKHPILLAMQHG